MDTASYSKQAWGRLLKQGRGEGAYHAFVPHSLPPALDFSVELVKALAESTHAVGELAGLAGCLPNPYLFVRPFIRREAVSSSRIEGTQASLDELYRWEAEQRVPQGLEAIDRGSDVAEVHNYVVALEHGLARLGKLPVSLRLVRELHEKLMQGVRGRHATPGQFRRSQNWIGPVGSSLTEAAYVPPPVPEMKEALGSLEEYLHATDDLPKLIRLALIHYQFEAIHPFIDGNGRVGRLLLALLAVHWRLVPQPLLYLSPFFERHREEYYALLTGVSTHGRWTDWIGFFLHGVAHQASEAIEKTRRLQDLQQQWRDQLTTGPAAANRLRLMECLFESPFVSIPAAQSMLGVSYNTAKSTVQTLLDRGLLRPSPGGAHPRLFVAQDIIAILRAPAE
ncbi:MAG: Fic family protein [Armatimonadetes bacterium]|nr:Fic family protein [Armatimonadota bacterium]